MRHRGKASILQNLVAGDPTAVARALTVVENGGPEVEALLAALPSRKAPTARLGITGPPGVGRGHASRCLSSGEAVAIVVELP